MSCLDTNNPTWSKLTVDAKNALALKDIYYSNEHWDEYNKTAQSFYEYIVVNGTPSLSPDINGRFEINPGDTVTDTRLYGGYLVFAATIPGGEIVNRQYISQLDDTNNKTTTITITNGALFSVGDIIMLNYK